MSQNRPSKSSSFKQDEMETDLAPINPPMQVDQPIKIDDEIIQRTIDEELAERQLMALPRDSFWPRIRSRCTVTSRRRGCKVRWRLSRIVWRHYADYNRLSGAMWATWSSTTQSERRKLVWPPPSNVSGTDYVNRYHRNVADPR